MHLLLKYVKVIAPEQIKSVTSITFQRSAGVQGDIGHIKSGETDFSILTNLSKA